MAQSVGCPTGDFFLLGHATSSHISLYSRNSPFSDLIPRHVGKTWNSAHSHYCNLRHLWLH